MGLNFLNSHFCLHVLSNYSITINGSFKKWRISLKRHDQIHNLTILSDDTFKMNVQRVSGHAILRHYTLALFTNNTEIKLKSIKLNYEQNCTYNEILDIETNLKFFDSFQRILLFLKQCKQKIG